MLLYSYKSFSIGISFAKKLATESLINLKKLQEIGEEMKDYKFVDMEIFGPDANVGLRCRDGILGYTNFEIPTPDKFTPLLKSIEIKAAPYESTGSIRPDKYRLGLHFETKEEAAKALEELRATSSVAPYERAAKIAKILEKNEAARAAENAIKKQEEIAKQEIVYDLLDKFGIGKIIIKDN